MTRISFHFKKENSYPNFNRKKTSKTTENAPIINQNFQRMNSVFISRNESKMPFGGLPSFQNVNRIGFNSSKNSMGLHRPPQQKYVNKEMKKNLLNRRKSRFLLNRNFGIYSNGKLNNLKNLTRTINRTQKLK